MRPLISSLFLLLVPGAALAAPGLPEAFHGTASGAVGTHINAIIAGTIVASTTIESAGVYGYAPHLFFIPDPSSNRAGAPITFTIGGKPATQTAAFANGSLTALNLSLVNVPTSSSTTPPVSITAVAGGTTSAISPPRSTLSTTTPAVQREYDLNHDRKVDALDYVLMLTNWGVGGKGSAADINADGIVNIYDFNLLMAHWTL